MRSRLHCALCELTSSVLWTGRPDLLWSGRYGLPRVGTDASLSILSTQPFQILEFWAEAASCVPGALFHSNWGQWKIFIKSNRGPMEDLCETPFATHMTPRKKKPTAPAMKRAVAGVGQSRIMRVCAVLCKEPFFCGLAKSECLLATSNSFNVQI